jgi:hypothetical protein
MALTRIRQAGRTVYRHVKEGMKSVDAIVHKAAMVYTLTHPLIRQAYDTRAIDANLMDGYVKYQQARSLTSQIDGIIN